MVNFIVRLETIKYYNRLLYYLIYYFRHLTLNSYIYALYISILSNFYNYLIALLYLCFNQFI